MVTRADVIAASDRIGRLVERTPLIESEVGGSKAWHGSSPVSHADLQPHEGTRCGKSWQLRRLIDTKTKDRYKRREASHFRTTRCTLMESSLWTAEVSTVHG